MSASPVLSVPCLPSCVYQSALSPFICLPSCVSLSGGVRLFGLVCPFFLHLSPFTCLLEWWCPPLRSCLCLVSLHLSVFICLPEWWCPPLRSCLCLVSLHLSPIMCFPEWRCPPFRSCRLRLSPIVSPFVCLCLQCMAHCLPVSSLHMCLRWISEVLPPLVSHLSPHKCACPGWCVRFPEVLSRMVFLLVSLCWMVCPLSRLVSPCFLCLPLPPIVCHCLPTCESAFPRSCLPLCPFLFPFVGWCVCPPCFGLSPIVSLFVSLCWMVCLPEDLSPLSPSLSPILSPSLPGFLSFLFPLVSAFQLVSLLVSVSWMVRASSRGLVSQLVSQLVFVLVSVCWMVRPPSRGFVSPFLSLSPSLSPFLFPFVGWCVRLPLVSHCLPSFFPFLDGLSAFPSPCPVCLPACVPVCLPACLSLVPQLKLSHAENCADSNVHRAPGLKMMCHLSLSSFDVFNTSNLTVLCCLLRAFGTKYLHPHRMLPSSFFGI